MTRAHHGWEIDHAYGDRVHILDDAFSRTALARLSSPEASRAEVLSLLRAANHSLLTTSVGRELVRTGAEIPTRMNEQHPGYGVYAAEIFDPDQRVVVCDVIRGGILPSQMCFELLTAVLPDDAVRLDHLTMSRVADDEGHVTGVEISGSKVGGTVEDATLILPDPMGATGGTVLQAVRYYEEHHGKPRKIVVLPTICTPEFLRAVLEHENIVVYSARLDRGLSAPDVLRAKPGERWNEERGLDDHSYIVPGAGGMGEILNNSWC